MTSDEWVQPPDSRELAAADIEPLELGTVDLTADPEETVLALAGEVDLSLAAELTEVSRAAIDRGLPIRLDVSGLTFLDSTAIGYIVTLAAAERDAGRLLRVVGADGRTTDTLELGGIADLVDLDGRH